MKTTRTKILFASILFSAVMPSMIFSAEEESGEQFMDRKDSDEKILSWQYTGKKDGQRLYTFTCKSSPAKKTTCHKKSDKPSPKEMGELVHLIVTSSPEIVSQWLTKNSHLDVNTQDEKGDPPIRYAIDNLNPELTLQPLLDHNADINYQDIRSRTILHFVAEKDNNNNSAKLVEYLLDNNANPTIKDKKGNTALKLAKKSGNLGKHTERLLRGESDDE